MIDNRSSLKGKIDLNLLQLQKLWWFTLSLSLFPEAILQPIIDRVLFCIDVVRSENNEAPRGDDSLPVMCFADVLVAASVLVGGLCSSRQFNDHSSQI
jgi:hypothetical protein